MYRHRDWLINLLVIALLCSLAVPSAAQRSKGTKSNLPPKGKPLGFYLSRGGRLLETGNYQQAILYLDAALNAPRKGVKPAVVQLLQILRKSADIYQEAKNLRDSGHAEAAIEKYRQIIALNPVDPKPLEFIVEIYDLLSEAAEKGQDFQEAARLYESWMQYAPRNEFPRQGAINNYLKAAQQADAAHNFEKALALYHKVLNLNPTDQTSAARALAIENEQILENTLKRAAASDPRTAINILNGGLSLFPDEPRLKEALRLAQGNYEMSTAEELMKNYQYHEARNYWQKTLNYLPEASSKVAERIKEINLRTGDNYQSDGLLRLRATVDSSVRVRLVGDTFSYLNGESGGKVSMAGALPLRPYQPHIANLEGDIAVQIVEMPTRSNGYATILLITPKKQRYGSFEVVWELQHSGLLLWRAMVTDQTTVRMQGPFIDTIGTASNIAVSCDPFPHEDYTIIVTKLQGSDRVDYRVVEFPTPANDYATKIVVSAKSEMVELQIDWILKRGKKN